VSATASVTAGAVSFTQAYHRRGNVAAEGRTCPRPSPATPGPGSLLAKQFALYGKP
jgi:hypothetical protein